MPNPKEVLESLEPIMYLWEVNNGVYQIVSEDAESCLKTYKKKTQNPLSSMINKGRVFMSTENK